MFNPFCISSPLNLQVLFSLSHISGVGTPCANVFVKINNCLSFQSTVNCNGRWEIPIYNTLKEGEYIIEAIQEFQGMCSSCFIKINIQNPNLKPLILIPQNNSTIDNNQPIISGVASPNSSVSITIEGNSTTESLQVVSNNLGVYKAKVNAPLKNGTYTITVIQHPCEIKSTIIFNIEVVLEPTTIAYPPNGSVIDDNQPIITGTATPGNLVTVCIEPYSCIQTTADSFGLFSIQFDTPLKNGTYQIITTQTDSLGNTSPQTITTITIAKPVPSPTIISPPNGAVIDNNQPEITGTATPGNTVTVCLSSYDCIDTIADSNGFYNVVFPIELPDDVYTLSVTQTDSLGNVSPEVNSEFTINTVLPVPEPEIIYPSNGSTISIRQPIISGVGIEGYTVEVCLSNSTDYGCILSQVEINGIFSAEFLDLLPQGNYIIKATQIDTEGRKSNTVTSTFSIEAILPVPEPVVNSPENGSTLADDRPFFTGNGNAGYTVKLCLSTMTLDICETTTVNEFGDYAFQFSNPLADDTYTLTTTQIDPFGNESTPILTTFNIATNNIYINTIEAIMGPSFRSIDLVFDISGTNNVSTVYYLLVPPGSPSPSISDMKNYPNTEALLNGTVARGQFYINITPELVKQTITVYGRDGITPIPGETGIVDGYNYDVYIYIEVSPTVNSGVISFGYFTMGMPFASGDGSVNSPFVILNLTESELLNYPDLLEGNPINKSGVNENARMLENIERLQVIYDETEGYYGIGNSLSLNYILNSNIDLSNYATAYNGEGWIPIGNIDASYYSVGLTGSHVFTGSLDGANHTISNLSMSPKFIPGVKWVENIGFIGSSGEATISNINLNNVNITPTIDNDKFLYVGSLIGSSEFSTIQGINILNTVIDVSSYVINMMEIYVGGMIGNVNHCIIDGSSSTSATSNIANVEIKSNSSTVTNCSAMIGRFLSFVPTFLSSISNYSIENLSETNTSDYNLKLGGVISILLCSAPLSIYNISIDGFNIKNNNVIGGGLIGDAYVNNLLEINNISINNITLNSTVLDTFIGGLIGYITCSTNENNVIIHDILVSNFDLSGTSYVGGLIGNLVTSSFDNSEFTLYNFSINPDSSSTVKSLSATTSYCGGIIGRLQRRSANSLIYIHDGQVYNEVDISVGEQYGGGLIGEIYVVESENVFTFIENCSVSANIDASTSSSSEADIGGLIGNGDSIALRNCSFKGIVSSPNYAGGLIGKCIGIYIGNSTANVELLNGTLYLGGITGYLQYKNIIPLVNPPFTTKNNTVELSNAVGNINSSKIFNTVGGLLGSTGFITLDQCFSKVDITSNSSSASSRIGMIFAASGGNIVTNCYSAGDLFNNITATYCGGIAGISSGGSTLRFCYSFSDISGNTNIGGIIGYNFNNVSNCFALNPRVFAQGAISGRICGTNSGGTLSQNYAINTLQLYRNGIIATPTVNPNGVDGGTTTLATLENDMINAGWDPSIWNFASINTLGRPTLINNPEI